MLRRAASSCVSGLCVPTAAAAPLTPKRTKVLIGVKENGLSPPIHINWTDIVGSNGDPGGRLAAGKVLAMLDMCAARASQAAADFASKASNERYLTCTVGVTNTMFSSPILNGDAVRLDGRVVHCGASSLGVYIRFYRLSPSTRTETPAGESFFTMVTITPDLKAAKVVPAMELTDPLDVAMHKRYCNIRDIQRENEAESVERRKKTLKWDEVDCPINFGKPMHVKVEATKTQANRIFFTSCLNNNNTVFGGELMSWMEMHAVHCGRMFTGNRHIYTLGMHSVAFPEPVFSTDWVSLEANVIYVRNTTIEVDVVLRAERSSSGLVVTNRASFVLINNDDIGQKAAIPVGLDLSTAPQEQLQLFMEARARYHRSVGRRETFKQLMEGANTTRL